MSTTATTVLPLLVEEVEVTAVERLSPSFVRLWLGSPAFAELDCDGPTYDQRIKLVFPHPGHPLMSVEGFDASWYDSWLSRPLEERGHMRTYTLRGSTGRGRETRMSVDFVLHGDGGHGPGGDFAASAQVGDRLVALAPRRGHLYGGIEFAPGDASHLLLVGDETAVPAIAAILEQLPADARGSVFLEVPLSADVLPTTGPDGVSVSWVPRDGGPRGTALHAAVLDHLGRPDALGLAESVADDEVDPDLWETPEYSSSGEQVAAETAAAAGDRWAGCYFWIAGESKTVTGLRRALVKELGVDRRQVAFMGYWREGVAMKS